MERLTKYKPTPNIMFPYKLIDNGANTELDAIHKLGKLEDIEEELNCPIEVLHEALKNGIYGILRGTDKLYNHTVIADDKSLYAIPLDIYDDQWLIKDYKKTWWLREDKSE